MIAEANTAILSLTVHHISDSYLCIPFLCWFSSPSTSPVWLNSLSLSLSISPYLTLSLSLSLSHSFSLSLSLHCSCHSLGLLFSNIITNILRCPLQLHLMTGVMFGETTLWPSKTRVCHYSMWFVVNGCLCVEPVVLLKYSPL